VSEAAILTQPVWRSLAVLSEMTRSLGVLQQIAPGAWVDAML